MAVASTPIHSLDEAERLLEELEGLEKQLRGMREELSRSQRLVTMGTLATSVVHEINNILTPMIGRCDLAMRSPGDVEQLVKAVQASLAGAERAAAVCGSMLNFARGPAGAGPCCVAQALDEAVACMVRPPERDGIELSVRIDRRVSVAMPQVSLQQVLLNLLLNARRAMAGRGGRLTIRTESRGDRVLIFVADTGTGIAPQVRRRLFEPFATGQSDVSPHEPRGTGLGLATCRDILQQARGSIRLTRTDPTGTEFQIDLPSGSAMVYTDSK